MKIRPVTKREKINAEKSIREVAGDKTTICEHVRMIFRIAEDEVGPEQVSKKIMEECRIVCSLAKRMNARLVEYHQGDYEL